LTTRLALLHPDDDRMLLVDGALPAVEDPFAADLGVHYAVLRTLRRDGDDKIVLAEALDDRAAAGVWSHVDLDIDDRPCERWQRRGWLSDALRWIEDVAGPQASAPVQLRHWALSAVIRVGDVVLKEVPSVLSGEGNLTAALGAEAPGAVPFVLAVDHERFLMRAFHAETRSVEPDGLLALGDLQRRAAVDAVDRSLDRLPDDARGLTPNVLREDRYELAPTDGRLPPRRITDDDLEVLEAMIAALPDDIDRLPPLPDTIVHGDLHVHNVAWVEDRCLIFDWGMGSRSHPFMDLPMWEQWATTGSSAFAPYFAGWGVEVDWTRHRHVAHLFHAVTCLRLIDVTADDPRSRLDWAAGAQTQVLRALSSRAHRHGVHG
jgi:hypothetical protein